MKRLGKNGATHDGVFQADEVFGIAALILAGVISSVIRTRVPEILESCAFRVDVGGKNNPKTGDYDHHQTGGAGARDNGIPYASFGLVWKEFGPGLCSCAEVAKIVDRRLVQVVDALDCGEDLYTELRYKGASVYTIGDLIASFNPNWWDGPTAKDFDCQFSKAVALGRTILRQEIVRAHGTFIAQGVVREALAKQDQFLKGLLILDWWSPEWPEIIADEAPEVQFVVFPTPHGTWRIQGVPKVLGHFELRRQLPKRWAGKNGTEFATITGVGDAIFCRPGRFIADAKTKEGALQLVALAMTTED